MNKLLNFFRLKERNSSILNEIIGGLIIFVSMIYILPTNSTILSEMGMNSQGVFIMTALISFVCCLLMGLLANIPIGLSTGMGLNSFLTYTVCQGMGFTWQETMFILFISGILFFVLSITPIRTIIINKIPQNMKYIISAGLGCFICYVGLRGGGHGIINISNGLTSLGSLSDPSILIPFIGIFLIVTLMFFKKVSIISKLAIPIGVLVCLVLSVSINYGLYGGNNQYLASISGNWGFDSNSVKEVVFFGLISNSSQNFSEILINVFSNPGSYLAIFSLTFVNLFDTTATLLTVGRDCDLIDEDGQMQNGTRAIIADATGSLICAPLGTSTITSFAESCTGIAYGARTGIAAIVVGIMFLLSGFAYPIFSLFSSWSVTAPALIVVGGVIFANNLKDLDWKDFRYAIVAFFSIIFMILTYSLSNGLGIGIILFVLINLISFNFKENNLVLYIIAGLYVVSFILNELI